MPDPANGSTQREEGNGTAWRQIERLSERHKPEEDRGVLTEESERLLHGPLRKMHG